MKRHRLTAFFLAGLLLGSGIPASVAANDAGFNAFCRSWMKKLAARETFNRDKANIVERAGQFVKQYTGYSRRPVSCKAQRTRGAKKGALRESQPVAVKRAPVTEIFSHDGKDWLY